MISYNVTVERGDRYWLIHAPAVDRSTQARNLREVDAMARDLIGVMLDADPESITVHIAYVLPPSIQKHMDESERLRQEAALANSASAAESRAAARALTEQDVPLRDIGLVLGVSHQRAHQLVTHD